MGRDILHKLGIGLTASKPTGKTIDFISDFSTSSLGRSKNHMSKSADNEKLTPTQQKGSRIPLDNTY